MSAKTRYKYPLQIPESLKETVIRLAKEDGVSVNQWIVAAIAQKVGAVETAEEFLIERAGNAVPKDLTKFLDQAADEPPLETDIA
ncbi:MAG: pilus assembly protein HicB [Ponticaulis sp.]|nr:pilus assembly protein HicB [Ponticaulis sp.]|tara:strand:+ start:6864 stop:7118 length:255 start_codon:yes stop_codon:yes gene_type:complete